MFGQSLPKPYRTAGKIGNWFAPLFRIFPQAVRNGYLRGKSP